MQVRPRIQTPLPPPPADVTGAIATSHRLLAALVARDVHGAGAMFEPDACVWESRGGALPAMEEPDALARTLLDLLDGAPPSRLSVIAHGARTALTSAYAASAQGDDRLLWTLEVQVDAEQVVAAYLRGLASDA